MSALIAAKIGDTVVLATDSREVNLDTGEILSDARQKIFYLGHGIYYASSGYSDLCFPLAKRAGELGGSDIRALADKLDEMSAPLMVQVFSQYRHLHTDETDALYTYDLVGLINGRPGYLSRQFRFVGGEIKTETFEAPDDNNRMCFTRSQHILGLACAPGTWVKGAVAGVEHLINHLRTVEPEVGGPLQMVYVNRSGHGWIHRVPMAVVAGNSLNAQGAVQVNIPVAGPTYVDVNNALNLRVDGTTIHVDGSGNVVLGTVPLSNVVATLNGAGWTYGGNLALQQLVVGTGTATFLSTATFKYAPSSGPQPCVQVGAAGAVFKDDINTPVNTMTCSSAGITIIGGASSGVTIQSAAGLTAPYVSIDSLGLIIASKSGAGAFVVEITSSALYLTYNGTPYITLNSSGITIAAGATINTPSISGGSISGTSFSITTSGSGGSVSISTAASGVQVTYGSYTASLTAAALGVGYGPAFANVTAVQIVIANGTGDGCYMNPGGYFQVAQGYTSYNGGTFTFQDLAGATHTVKGGILIS
jgi:hypothetical protein